VHDPFLLLNMEKTVDRIIEAIDQGERICIYGDYDADGIPAGIILKNFFEKINHTNFFNYIPHREVEGFGLNLDAISKIKNNEASLIITVDCGITGIEEVEEANRLGIDVIITDHHLPNSKVPKAFAIINPKQKGDKYPFKDLCGAGVAYKLVQAILKKRSFDLPEGWEKWLLDMVAIATVSDMVPLVGENRALVFYGLKVLRKSKRPGLKMLLKTARVNQGKLTEDDIGFIIAPRINAASRMDSPEVALIALGSNNKEEAEEAVSRLEHMNNERKGSTAAIIKEVRKKLDSLDEVPEIIVSGNPKWRPGILGLVANTLAEEFDKPVYLWGRGDSPTIKGSFRSNQKIDTFSLTSSLPEGIFINFGGHTFAGGFELEENKVHYLAEELLKKIEEDNFFIEDIETLLDDHLRIEEINLDYFKELERVSPYGMGNPKPIFLLEKTLISDVLTFGKEGLHTKVLLREGEKTIEAIKFFDKPENFTKIPNKDERVNIVAFVENSFFMGRSNLRLRIQDIF